MISYKSYVLVVCCTGQSAIPGAVEQKSNNECAVAKKTVGNVMYGVTFLFLSFHLRPLGVRQSVGVGDEMRAPRSKSVHREKGSGYVCVDGLCVMIPEVPKRTYTRLHFVRKHHHFPTMSILPD